MAELEDVGKSGAWDECKEADRDQTIQRRIDHAKEFCSHSFFKNMRKSLENFNEK